MELRRFLRIAGFELRQFAGTGYFVQTVVVATLSASVVQRLGVMAWHSSAYECFLRSGMIGMWTSSISAAGIIGFERMKGTLVYLVSGRQNATVTLLALVSSVSTFSLLAFPISCIVWLIPGNSGIAPMFLLQHLPQLAAGVILLWAATLSITLFMALISVMTPQALVFEGLILVPALFFSGVFAVSSPVYQVLGSGAVFILPTASAARFLYSYRSPHAMLSGGIMCAAVTAVWIAAAAFTARYAFRAMRRTGTIEVI